MARDHTSARTSRPVPVDFDYELNLFAMQMQRFQYRSRLYPDELWLIWSLLDLDCYDVNARDDRGIPPIVYAAKRGSIVLLRLLLRYKADINASTTELETSLIIACRKKRMRTVRFLLEHGAQANIIDKSGFSALRWAVQHEHFDLLYLLLRYGVSVLQDSYTRGSALERAKIGTTKTHAIMLALLEKSLLLERHKLLEGLQQKQQQDEIKAISMFQKKKKASVASAEASVDDAKQKSFRKLHLRRSDRRSSKQQRVLPVSSPGMIRKSVIPVAPIGLVFSIGSYDEEADEGESRRWVRVGRGKWKLLTNQDAAAVKSISHLKDSSSDSTETAVMPFAVDDIQSQVTPANLIRSEGQWNEFMSSSSPKKVVLIKSATPELTIEDLS